MNGTIILVFLYAHLLHAATLAACIQRSIDAGATRTTLLALHAFKEAVADAGLTNEALISPDTAFIGATTVGGMCLMDELYRDANSHIKSPFSASYDCASVNMFLQKRYQMMGIINTINTACSSSANAIMYGARLVRNGLAKRVIVGGVDSLSKFTIHPAVLSYGPPPEKDVYTAR